MASFERTAPEAQFQPFISVHDCCKRPSLNASCRLPRACAKKGAIIRDIIRGTFYILQPSCTLPSTAESRPVPSKMSSLPLDDPALALSFEPTPLTIVQLEPQARVPSQIASILLQNNPGDVKPPFISFTRTRTEISIILPSQLAAELFPQQGSEEPPRAMSGPWSALVVRGPMDLALTGIMHALTGPLKDAAVPVFANSTWDTDYVLINKEKEGIARGALERAGWRFWS